MRLAICDPLVVESDGKQQQATILHADLDAFYASVEQRDNPELVGQAVLVGGQIIMAASYEARAQGVSTPMNRKQALAICPDAVVIDPRPDAYSAASEDVMAILEEFSPTIEKMSIDEAFLDGGGMEHIHGTPREIAEKIRATVREEVGLPITVGVARTKFMAKVASGAAKPDGLLVVEPADEESFLHPMPVEAVWGVGKITAAKLRSRGVDTVGDIVEMDPQTLEDVLGTHAGRRLHALARGEDPRRVESGGRRKSIGAQRALPKQPRTLAELETIVASLVDRAAPRLRAAGRSARTVELTIRFGDFSRITRSKTLPAASSATEEFVGALRTLLGGEIDEIHERGITLIGIGLSNLEQGDQLELPIGGQRRVDVDAAVDAVRQRFGGAAIERGAAVGKDEGFVAPKVED
jgi:DNA polymerase-4